MALLLREEKFVISNTISCWVVICFLDFGLTVWGVTEERYLFTPYVIFLKPFRIRSWFLRWCSLQWRCLWFYINSVWWLGQKIGLVIFDSRVILISLSNFGVSRDISRGCCRTTSGIGWIIVFVISGQLIVAPDWRRGIPDVKAGLQLGYFHLIVLGVVLSDLSLSCRSLEVVHSELGILGSEEVDLAVMRCPKCNFQFCWTPETFSSSFYPQLSLITEYYEVLELWEILCIEPG